MRHSQEPGDWSAEQVFVEHPWLAGDPDFCVMARRIIAGGEVDLIKLESRIVKWGVNDVKGMKEVPLIDLTQDSEK